MELQEGEGGGIILDMVCHWRYVLDNLFGDVESVSCLGATHIPKRWDEDGKPYTNDVDDAAYATFQLKGGVIAHINMSWCTRVRRDDLVTFHVDGTHGSAVAGLQKCWSQRGSTRRVRCGIPTCRSRSNSSRPGQEVPGLGVYDNGFKTEWEMFIRHLYEDAPFKWTLLEGAKGVQLVEAAHKSWKERRWIDIPALKVVIGRPSWPRAASPPHSVPTRQSMVSRDLTSPGRPCMLGSLDHAALRTGVH